MIARQSPNSKYRTYIVVGLVAVVLIYLGILYIQYKNVNDEINKAGTLLKKAMEKPRWDSASLWDPAMYNYYKKNPPAALLACSARINKIANHLVDQLDRVESDMETIAAKSSDDRVVRDYFQTTTTGGQLWNYNTKTGNSREIEIKFLINNTRENMLSVLDSLIANNHNVIKKQVTINILRTERERLAHLTSLIAEDQIDAEGNQMKWEVMYQVHSPIAGIHALLSKYENDTRALESEITFLLVRLITMEEDKSNTL